MPSGPNCKGCPLEKLGSGFMKPDPGDGTISVALIGEALGEVEASLGAPFRGPSGSLLDRIITRMTDPETGGKLSRAQFPVANVVWCRPPDNELVGAPWEQGAISQCSSHLSRWLEQVKPRAILALGGTAFKWLTGQSNITKLRGYVFPSRFGPVVGTYHPSFLMKGKWHLSRVVQADLGKAIYVSRHGAPKAPTEYQLFPSPVELEEFHRRLQAAPEALLAFDIETPYAGEKDEDVSEWEQDVEDDPTYTILRCSFAFEPYKAITFPWTHPYDKIAAAILSLPNEKTVWNAAYDVPRLTAAGAAPAGRIHDAMLAWHALEPALPMGLKFAATFLCPDVSAWALESKDRPEFYSATDSDVLLRAMLTIRSRLQAAGSWDMFNQHFTELYYTLRKMAAKGIRVDQKYRRRARQVFINAYGREVAAMQPHVPIKIRKVKAYKKTEEALRASGKWVEGKMVPLPTEIHYHDYGIVPSDDPAYLLCDCGKRKKAPKPKKARKKKGKDDGEAQAQPASEV